MNDKNKKMLDYKNSIPIVHRVYPTVIANEIVDCQPMTNPYQEIFTLKPTRRADPSKCYE